MLQTMTLQSKLSSHYVFQSHAAWLYYGIFQSVNSKIKSALQNHLTKNI